MLRDDELCTVAAVVAAVLNSRPLTYCSNDSNDAAPLTPAHFLGRLPYASIGSLNGENFSYTKRWHSTQKLLDQFWVRFETEYLTSIGTAQKWLKERRNFVEGDVVVVFEASDVNKWPLGVIEKTVTSPLDGLVRTVHVRRGGKLYVRDASQVSLLVPHL